MAEEPAVEKKQKKKFDIKDVVILGIILALVLMILTGMTIEKIGNGLNEFLYGKEQVILGEKPADVELYKFDELHDNTSMSAEIWVINIGEETASNLSVFVRVRNQTGAILFEKNIPLSTYILRRNESCTGVYSISYTNNTKELFTTIEVKWNSGRHGYQR